MPTLRTYPQPNTCFTNRASDGRQQRKQNGSMDRFHIELPFVTLFVSQPFVIFFPVQSRRTPPSCSRWRHSISQLRLVRSSPECCRSYTSGIPLPDSSRCLPRARSPRNL